LPIVTYFRNIVQRLAIFVEGVKEDVHLFLGVVLFGSMPPPLLSPIWLYHGQCGSLPLLYLTPSSLYVAVRASLSQMAGEGGGGVQDQGWKPIVLLRIWWRRNRKFFQPMESNSLLPWPMRRNRILTNDMLIT
jgi:hypothetical protein